MIAAVKFDINLDVHPDLVKELIRYAEFKQAQGDSQGDRNMWYYWLLIEYLRGGLDFRPPGVEKRLNEFVSRWVSIKIGFHVYLNGCVAGWGKDDQII